MADPGRARPDPTARPDAGVGPDAEAGAVYAAEDAVADALALRRFSRFADIERYVATVTTSAWWDESFPGAPVESRVLRRSRSATWSAACSTADEVGVVALVDGRGWGLETVLHELAHLAVGPASGHGPAFRRGLLELWRHEAGIQAWAALRAELAASG
jgi:putative metallohydrolase (TIGR04338 family)